MTIALSVFFVGIIIAVVVGLGFRNRAATAQTAQRAKPPKSKPLASADSQADDAAMVPIRRKKGLPAVGKEAEPGIGSYSIEDNENLNPILDEESSNVETSPQSEVLWSSKPTSPASTTARSMLSSMVSAKPRYQTMKDEEG